VPVDEVPAAGLSAAGPGEVRAFSALVRRAALAAGNSPAVVAGDVRLTWAEVDERVDRAAAGYVARGLEAGDRVAVQLRNGVDWVVAAMGALRAGLVVVPVNTAFTDAEVTHLLTDSGARLLVVGAEQPELAGVPVSVGPPVSADAAPADPEDPDALALLAYTSGTRRRYAPVTGSCSCCRCSTSTASTAGGGWWRRPPPAPCWSRSSIRWPRCG
jgi:long-chain acyl-CoA synthetase